MNEYLKRTLFPNTHETDSFYKRQRRYAVLHYRNLVFSLFPWSARCHSGHMIWIILGSVTAYLTGSVSSLLPLSGGSVPAASVTTGPRDAPSLTTGGVGGAAAACELKENLYQQRSLSAF